MPNFFKEQPKQPNEEQPRPLFLSASMTTAERKKVIEKAAENPDSVDGKFLNALLPGETKVFNILVDRYKKPVTKREKYSFQSRSGMPLPEGGSYPRPSSVIKAERINAGETEQTEQEPPLTLRKKIEQEGLAAVQAQVVETVLAAMKEYISEQSEDGTLAINKEATRAFMDGKEDECRDLLIGNKENFAKNAREFITYVRNELKLGDVPKIAQRLELLRLVAELSLKPEDDISDDTIPDEEKINA